MFKKLGLAAVVALLPMSASATAIITDGNVSLGVDTLGQLNVGGGVGDVRGETDVGVRWIDPAGTQYESTSHGCLCEGWGLALDEGLATQAVGFADNALGISGLTADSFASTATTATSVVQITGTDVYVTHDFALSSETDDLYVVNVTIENRGATDVASMEYRRHMDWDTSPTPFSEYVEIGGTATTTLLSGSGDNGFLGGNPLTAITDLGGCGLDTDFLACGPRDHGAVFDFDLGGLAAGESYDFSIYYGGAANRDDALAALGAVGAELYSFGWSGTDADQNGVGDSSGATTPTFIFAFKGVGGTVVVPPPTTAVPLPAGAWLLIGGLGMLGWVRRRKVVA